MATSMSTNPDGTVIPGVDRDALVDAIRRDTGIGGLNCRIAADAVLAHIAAHHECACDREHDDEWVEVRYEDAVEDLPKGVRVRQEWTWCVTGTAPRLWVHRDDLPTDPDADAANALRDASWSVPRLADGSRPDPLPGLPEARDLLTALHEHGWTVTRKEER